MMKRRFLYNEIIQYLEHKNALVITGMRQVGKTTLLRQIYQELNQPKLWFDFDNPLDQLLFENTDFNAVYKRLLIETGNQAGRLFVFIDEIQNFPRITKVIKYLIDHHDVKFIVTGSSNFYLKNLFPESLSGRKFLFVLYPMGFREYLYFMQETGTGPDAQFPAITGQSLFLHEKYSFHYDQFLEFGGFPEVVMSEDPNLKNMILRNIFASFFEKDLQLLSDIKDIRELRDMILLLVARTGNILDITRISAELGIHRVKAYHYLEFLQGVFFIHLIPKFTKSIDRSVAGGKKIYFSDTGLLNIIGKTNEGQLFENAVANQLLHHGSLAFYNKRNTAEIDFILDQQIAFEVKQTGTPGDITRLEKNSKELDLKQYFLVSRKYLDMKGFLSPVII
jgi:predicted AAA+ superfamily ATPase